MGWCDDPNSKKYNRFIKLPTKFKHEKLHRKDNLYDLVLVTNFNMKPTIKNKGSAIFIHVANKKYSSTKGCIAVGKNDLIKLIKEIKKNSKIIVN
jgi:L,D-peptidoglycan transpeptidase YkuD (ErfK/YbiS/YcfS/YnhG family)